MTWQHKLLLRLFLAASLALALPRLGYAQTVVCANCGTEWTQLANYLQLLNQLQQQVALVQRALQQYQNMVSNTQGLDRQVWSNALAEIRQLNRLLGQASSLSFASGNLDGRFSQKYGDYQSYVAQQLGGNALSGKYKQWSEDTNSSVLTTLKAAGLQSEQITGSEDSYLRHLESLAGTAQGRMQALQVSNQVAITTARQMQKLRQLMLVHLQLQANYIQTQMDRDAAQTAAWRNFATKRASPATSGKRY